MRKHLASAIGVFFLATAAIGAVAYQSLALMFLDGTAGAPAIGFKSDTDTGIYRSAADTVGISGGGSAAITVTPGTMAFSKATATNSITSATADAVTSATVAAITLAAAADITASDLILEVNDSSGNQVLGLTEAGALTTAGGVSFTGGTLALGATASTNTITSASLDATTSGTVAAITLAAGVNITATDLVLNVEDSSGTNLLTVAENGNTVAAGTLTFGASGTAMAAHLHATATDLDIGTAGAGSAVTADVVFTGAALGDICNIAPLQDDAAWDEGTLTCFVEGTDDVKVIFHADGTGADPAATNDYIVMLIKH